MAECATCSQGVFSRYEKVKLMDKGVGCRTLVRGVNVVQMGRLPWLNVQRVPKGC